MRLEHSKPTRDDRERRHLTVLSGEIVFNGGATTRDCLVRNISPRHPSGYGHLYPCSEP